MRLFLLSLTITLTSSFAPVLAASGDVYLVYRPDEFGHYPTKTHEKWIENPPVVGVNIPSNCIVEKLILNGTDKNLENYKRTSSGIVYDPPIVKKPEVVPESTEEKLTRVIKEKADDSKLTDAEWLKLFRASKSENQQAKKDVLEEVQEKKLEGG